MRKRRVNTRWRRVHWLVTDLRAGTVTEEVRWVQAVEPAEFARGAEAEALRHHNPNANTTHDCPACRAALWEALQREKRRARATWGPKETK